MPEGDTYSVATVRGQIRFYRFLTSKHPQPRDFTSNRDLGKNRRHPVEDAIVYRGFSAFESLESARDRARHLNRVLPNLPDWTHVATFLAGGRFAHGCARTFKTPGHWTLWGEPDEFASSVDNVFPI